MSEENMMEQYEYPEIAPDGPYRILNQHHSKPRKLRVACVGAGASGLCLAYKMGKMLVAGTWELTLFDKNSTLGGTWFENTYPGVANDIPSHVYTFSWDPNPNYSQYYAAGSECQQYFEGFADRHDSRKYMRLNTRVLEGRWIEAEGIWRLILEDTKTKEKWYDWAHIFVNGSGILNDWKWPDVDGLHDFQGALMHSASWDHSVEFHGKRVGVIGTGSTSVQIVPQLQKICSQLKVFMRSPTWISPPFGAGTLARELTKGAEINPGFRQYTFTAEDKERFRSDPAHHLDFRKSIEAEINSAFGIYKQGSDLSNFYRKIVKEEMFRRIGPGHEELKQRIIPTWSPGCRRISPVDGFLEALVSDNVEPVFGNLAKVTADGIVMEDGTSHQMDVLVCATGFKVAFKPAFSVINGSGTPITSDWSSGPNLYMGFPPPRFPNYFTVVGPGATWSSGTLLPSIETTVEYTVKMLKKMQTEGIHSLTVKQDALDELYAHFDEFHKKTVWQEECRSWFKDGQVKNRIYLWPGSTIHFVKTIKEPRYEDYDIRYRFGNRFAYLGNGEVKAMASRDVAGLSPYIRNSDHEWSVD